MAHLALLAFKSIIQAKPWCQITNAYLLARMSGYDSIKNHEGKENRIPTFIQDYMKSESKRRRLFTWLETHTRFRRKLGNQKGIVYSLTLSRTDLTVECQKSKFMSKSRKLDEIKKREKKEAEEKFNQWKKKNFGIN